MKRIEGKGEEKKREKKSGINKNKNKANKIKKRPMSNWLKDEREFNMWGKRTAQLESDKERERDREVERERDREIARE